MNAKRDLLESKHDDARGAEGRESSGHGARGAEKGERAAAHVQMCAYEDV